MKFSSFRNNFLKKNCYRRSIFLKDNNFKLIHYIIYNLKNCHINFTYFIKCKIVKGFIILNKNRLKNIFLNIIKDIRIWIEIDKLLNFGIVDISNDIFYRNFDLKNFNSLAYFLFNVYLSEFDFYAFSLCNRFYFKNNNFSEGSIYSKLKYFYFNEIDSLKLYRKAEFFKKSKNFKIINKKNSKFIDRSQHSFFREILYFRYLNYFLVPLVSSKLFSLKLKNKIVSFLKSNLFLQLDFVYVFPFSDNNIFFLGYNVKYLKTIVNYRSFYSLDINKFILFNKLFIKKFKFTKLFFTHFYVNIVENFNKFFFYNRFFKMNFVNKFFWLYFIQVEAVNSIQFNRVFFTKILFETVSFHSFSFKFRNYSFRNFLNILTRNTRAILFESPLSQFTKFNFSNDLFIKNLFSEFSLKYLFLFQNFSNFSKRKLIKLRFYYLGKNFSEKNFLFSKSDILKIDYSFRKFIKHKKVFFYKIEIFVSIKKMYEQLRFFGFVHLIKKKPIANIKYVFIEDFYLIEFFSFFSYSLLSWFKLSFNFLELSLILSLIKKSCFLTLARKHKKSINWSFQVYTRDLFFFSFFSQNNEFFQKTNHNFYFDELVFLNF